MKKGNKINHDGSDIEILLMQVRWNFREKQDEEIGISYDYDYVNTPVAYHDNIRNAGIPDKVVQAYVDGNNEQLAVVKEVTRKPIHDELLQEEVPEELIDKVYLLYDDWKVGEDLGKDDIRRYNGELWKIDQPHTSQAHWLPGEAHSLYTRIRKAGISEWKQPIAGLDEPYMKGDKVTYNGDTWENEQDNNFYAPGAWGWIKI